MANDKETTDTLLCAPCMALPFAEDAVCLLDGGPRKTVFCSPSFCLAYDCPLAEREERRATPSSRDYGRPASSGSGRPAFHGSSET